MIRPNATLPPQTALALSLVAALLSGCGGPTVQSFEVAPRRVCEGDTVEIRWQATDEARLTSEPDLPVAGTVAASDTLRVVPVEQTRFRLSVVDGQDYDEQTVLVYGGTERDTLGHSTSAVGDSAVTASFEVPSDKYADVLRIQKAENLSGRRLTVRHAGHQAVLPADTMPSDALNGWAPEGSWELRGPLVAGEVMGDPDRPPPENLSIRVDLECQP